MIASAVAGLFFTFLVIVAAGVPTNLHDPARIRRHRKARR